MCDSGGESGAEKIIEHTNGFYHGSGANNRFHAWQKLGSGVPPNNAKWALGNSGGEIRCSNGYVVLWRPDEVLNWILAGRRGELTAEFYQQIVNGVYSDATPHADKNQIETYQKGNRNNQLNKDLYRAICKRDLKEQFVALTAAQKSGLPAREILETQFSVLQARVNAKCAHDNIENYGPLAFCPGCGLFNNAMTGNMFSVINDMEDHALAYLREQYPPEAKPEPDMTLDELEAKWENIDPVHWLQIDRDEIPIVMSESVAIWGPEGEGKSRLGHRIAEAALKDGLKVRLILYEDPKEWGIAMRKYADNIHNISIGDHPDDECDLVIIDPLGLWCQAHNLDENKDGPKILMQMRLKWPKGCRLFIHHPAQDNAQKQTWMRGSRNLRTGPRVIMQIKREKGQRVVVFNKFNLGPPLESLFFDIVDGRVEMHGERTDESMKIRNKQRLVDEIDDAIELHPEYVGLSIDGIAERIKWDYPRGCISSLQSNNKLNAKGSAVKIHAGIKEIEL